MLFISTGVRMWRQFAALGLLGLGSILQGADLPTPVGWWSGDATLEDLAGTNSAASGTGSGYAEAVFAKGFAFDGRGDAVTVPDVPAQHPTRITIACWAKFHELLTPGAATPGLQYLMFKKRPANSGFEGYTLVKDRLSGTDRLKFVIARGAGAPNQVVVTGTTIVETNRFYFVAGTSDGSQARLYVNGVLESQAAAPFLIQCGTSPLVFGSSGESYNGHFSGVLDEPQIFDRALNQSEIQALYEQASVAPQLAIRTFQDGVEVTWPARFANWPVELSNEMQIWLQEPLFITRAGYTLSTRLPHNGEAGFIRLKGP